VQRTTKTRKPVRLSGFFIAQRNTINTVTLDNFCSNSKAAKKLLHGKTTTHQHRTVQRQAEAKDKQLNDGGGLHQPTKPNDVKCCRFDHIWVRREITSLNFDEQHCVKANKFTPT
jgi:hypothetical protein